MLKTIPKKGIELVDSLRKKGFRLYVLSNTNSIHLEAFRKIAFEEHGIKDFDGLFDKVYYSHLVQKRKPNTSIFEYVLQNAGLKADETLFIDDNEPNLIGARKTGLNTFLHDQDNCIYQQLTQFLKLD
jgi:putative hydrolase of the HAD superfamily